ncbi:MAG: hypothetical protein JOY62_05580 [Acidobacteriaceae bacterium]|nr:hypothetical protein [Acidobacteriaceae bacterium]MBV9779428.1 hypothetical protein [Acidobacteriaceae bacterium]
MRKPITVEVTSFDLNNAEPQIDAAVKAFAEYAEQVPAAKSTRSKYGLLGPSGKAITELKAGRYHRDSLIGYTLRTHESARTRRWVPEPQPEAISALERAVDQILEVLKSAPKPYHSEILDRLHYGLYYRLRRKQIERKEALRQKWVQFLEKRYKTKEAIGEAWKREMPELDAAILPKKQATATRRQGRSAIEQKDIEEFYASLTEPFTDEDNE